MTTTTALITLLLLLVILLILVRREQKRLTNMRARLNEKQLKSKAFITSLGQSEYSEMYTEEDNTIEIPLEHLQWCTMKQAGANDTPLRLQWSSSILERNFLVPLPNDVVVKQGRVTFPIRFKFSPEELEYGKQQRIYEQIFVTIYHDEVYLRTVKFVIYYDAEKYQANNPCFG